MKFKYKKVDKPARVPQIGWTIFIGLCGFSGFIGVFDSATSNSNIDKFMSAAVGIGFSLWAVLRSLETKSFQYKLRARPRLGATVAIFVVGLTALISVFDSTSNNLVTDKLLSAFVGIGSILWAVLRFVFGKEFKKNNTSQPE
jgi:hypothetical protein